MQQAQSELAVRWHYEAIERRRRMAAVQPRLKEKPAVRSLIIRARRLHSLDATIYVKPIGPIRVLARDFLLISSKREEGEKPRITAKQIIREVAAKRALPVNDIIGPWRRADLVHARRECAYRMRTETTMSFPQIARALGKADHTSSLHLYRTYKARLEQGLET